MIEEANPGEIERLAQRVNILQSNLEGIKSTVEEASNIAQGVHKAISESQSKSEINIEKQKKIVSQLAQTVWATVIFLIFSLSMLVWWGIIQERARLQEYSEIKQKVILLEGLAGDLKARISGLESLDGTPQVPASRSISGLWNRLNHIETALAIRPNDVVAVSAMRSELEALRSVVESNYDSLRGANEQNSTLLIGTLVGLLVSIFASLIRR